MNRKKLYMIGGALGILLVSVFGPGMLSKYANKHLLGKTVIREDYYTIAQSGETLSDYDKLELLAMALKGRPVIQSEYAAAVLPPPANQNEDYAFVPLAEEGFAGIALAEAVTACTSQLSQYAQSDGIPGFTYDPALYDIGLYAAVVASNPDKNLPVWQISFNHSKPLARMQNVLIEAYLDGYSGKLYLFSIRTESPGMVDPDFLIAQWQESFDLGGVQEFAGWQSDNPDLTAKAYSVYGQEGESLTLYTGFYEGIHEYFIRIYDEF